MKVKLFDVTIKKKGLDFLQRMQEGVTGQLLRTIGRESKRITDVLKFVRLSHHSQYSVRRRTGLLYQRTTPITAFVSGTDVIGGTRVGAGLPYTGIHTGTQDQGDETVITPKKAKFLKIPLYPVLDNRGVILPAFKDLRSRRDIFYPGKNSPLKKGYLYQRMPGGGARKVFALKSSVTVPRRVMLDSFADQEAPMVHQRVEADIQYFLSNMRMY